MPLRQVGGSGLFQSLLAGEEPAVTGPSPRRLVPCGLRHACTERLRGHCRERSHCSHRITSFPPNGAGILVGPYGSEFCSFFIFGRAGGLGRLGGAQPPSCDPPTSASPDVLDASELHDVRCPQVFVPCGAARDVDHLLVEGLDVGLHAGCGRPSDLLSRPQSERRDLVGVNKASCLTHVVGRRLVMCNSFLP